MFTGILIFFHVIACLLLIAVILFQVGRGHGLSGASFGQDTGVQTVFGTKTVDFLSKLTTTMAVVFMLTCISLDIIYSKQSKSLFAPGAGKSAQIDMEKIKDVLAKAKQAKESKESEAVSEDMLDETVEAADEAVKEVKPVALSEDLMTSEVEFSQDGAVQNSE